MCVCVGVRTRVQVGVCGPRFSFIETIFSSTRTLLPFKKCFYPLEKFRCMPWHSDLLSCLCLMLSSMLHVLGF